MNSVHSSAEASLNETKEMAFRLAHFDPTFTDEYGNQVMDYLVLDTLATYGPLLVVTASEAKERIKKVFKLDFAEEEINASLKRLGRRNMVSGIEVKRGEKPKFQVLPEIATKIQENFKQIKEMEDEVMNDWKEKITVKYREYPSVTDKIESIVENLQLFVSKMFVRHGIECVAILYPESPKLKQWLSSIESTILETLPKIDYFVDEIVKLEIPNFFKNPGPKRKLYITNLFNGSFFGHLVQVDEKCSRLLQEVTRGQKLYLDNNILVSLVGFDGADMTKAVHTILNLAKTLGYELGVTTKTVDEFQGSLDWRMKKLKQKPPLPRELARIAKENLGIDSFLTCYWDDFVKNGTSIEEFVSEKSYLKDILEGLEIKETDRFRKDIEGSQELKSEKSILRSVCINELGGHIVEHDAYHRIFIDKVRSGTKYRFSEATAWFLTHDSKLPVYDRAARKGKPSLPFCITSDQWVQVNRPLLMRTANQKEYEESFHVLVTLPFLRTMMPPFPLEKAYGEVLGRLARYKGMNKQLALNITTDRHFMVAVASETDEQKIEERIESKFVDLADQLQKDKKALEKQIEEDRREAKTLEERMSAIEETTKEKEKAHQKQIGRLVKKLEDERASSRTFKINLIKWSIFTGGLISTSLSLWWTLFRLPLPVTLMDKTIIGIVSQSVLIFAFLNIPLKQHWKIWLTCVIPLFLAILLLWGALVK